MKYILIILLFLAVGSPFLSAEDVLDPTVGMPGTLDEKVLPGTELEVIPRKDDRVPMILRLAATSPHGDSFRYNMIFVGLDPGEYDLRDYLQRKDGSSKEDLPELNVTVRALLEPGQVVPSTLEKEKLPWVGGYKMLLIGIGIIWTIGLMVLLFAGRKKKGEDLDGKAKRPKTFAEKIRPLVEKARDGELDTAEQAELERTLLGFWRKKLKLENESNFQALQKLRTDEEAGDLMRTLESWLHRPPRDREKIDVSKLLEPYDKPES